MIHVLIEAAQLLIHWSQLRSARRGNPEYAQHQEQMTERCAGITPVAARVPAAITVRQMAIQESRNDCLIDPHQLQIGPLCPLGKVGSAVEVCVNGVWRVTALSQIPLQCTEVACSRT